MAIYRSLGTLGNLIADIPWPVDFFSPTDLPSFLDKIFVQDYQCDGRGTAFTGTVWLAFEGELSVGLPGLEGVKLVVGSSVPGLTFLTISLAVSNESTVTLNNILLALRFDPSILKPVALTAGAAVAEFAEIQVEGSLRINGSFDLTVEGFDAFKLRPVIIGNTGVIISAEDVKLDLSRTSTLPEITAAGFDDSFIGVFIGRATVALPKDFPPLFPDDLVLNNCAIGSGGVSGELIADYRTAPPAFDPKTKTFTGRGTGTFFGIPFATEQVSIKFKQNALVESKITGQLLLPYFDKRVAVEVGLDLNGGFTIKLTGVVEQDDKDDASKGLFTLVKPGILSIELQSIGFEIKDSVFTTKLSGKVTPLFRTGDFDWPGFQVKELTIDSNGNIHLDGGWIDLPKQYSLDFYGFRMEITKLGLGKTDDGGKWIGFSGNLKLVEDFPNCGSVEGLRIIWYDDPTRRPKITFNGVGIEFEKKGIVSFKGAVAYREIEEPGKTIHRFDGAISLKLPKLKGVEIAATLVFGSESGPQGNYTFFAIYAAGEFPKGIPLFGTNLGLYGLAGLFALNMEPDKHPDEEWFEGWYKRPQIGVADIKNKWTNRNGSLALGAGATIGTVEDGGYKFSGKFLLAIIFPGPILLLEGKANMLKDRAKLSDDPTFRALAVLDERAGTFLLGLDAHYTKDESGSLIDIRGSAEAFFNLNDAGDWHLYLGKDEPRDKRIRAKVFKGLYQPAAYFMLDPKELKMGIWYGYDIQWKFSRLSVALQAWIESNVRVSWRPNQFQGKLWLHGRAELRAFGHGFGVNVDAKITADVFKPYHLLGDFSVGIPLPWPLHRISKNITLEWGPDPTPPDLPDPLEGIAIEHLKTTTSWPLSRIEGTEDNAVAPPPPGLPVVPLDCRPHITFKRSMNDDSLVCVNPQPVDFELIGDPAKGGIASARYSLTGVALHKWASPTWTLVANRGTTAVSKTTDSAEQLYGSWAPIPAEGDSTGEKIGQTKLWIWSKTPFDYTSHTERRWDEWFTNRFKRYPCIDIPADRVICCNFQSIAASTQLSSPWRCPDQPSIILSWSTPASLPVTELNQQVEGLFHALCLPGVNPDSETRQPNRLSIALLEPAKSVVILVAQKENAEDKVCVNFEAMQDSANPRVEKVFGFTEGVKFQVRDGGGVLLDQITIEVEETHLGTFTVFNCEYETEITLPCAASVVDLVLTLSGVPVTVTGFNEDGSVAELIFPQLVDQHCDYQPIPVSIIGRAVKRIVIRTDQGETGLLELCFRCGGGARMSATAVDTLGRTYGPVITAGDVIEIAGDGLTSVQIESESELCILQVCATIGPDANEVAGREAMARHLQDETVRLSQLDEVLEPNTIYRIAVATMVDPKSTRVKFDPTKYKDGNTTFAYFRTEGPPGLTRLSLPDGATGEFAVRNDKGKILTINDNHEVGEVESLDQLNDPGKQALHTRAILKSDLNDLTPYVKQTIPPTVAETGKPFLPRPVYRAYDVGVVFNENYVEALYRKARRDLGLYLYDNNNQPVRDAEGRLVVLNNRWGVTKNHTLEESEGRWISLISERNCASIDPTTIPRENTLTSQARGQVLNADAVYEARLAPLLMHEDFSEDLAGWSSVGASQWTKRGHAEMTGNAATVAGQAVSLDGLPDVSILDTSADVIYLSDDTTVGPVGYRILSYAASGALRAVTVDGSPVLSGRSSRWRIPARAALFETSGKQTTLLGGSPEWKDYRFSVSVRSTTDNPVGVVFRYDELGNSYSFVLDPVQKTAQLLKVIRANPRLLTTSSFVLTRDTDYLITVEAIGPTLQAYIDGAPVVGAMDAEISSGAIGLYSGGDPAGSVPPEIRVPPTVRFSDVRVDDFSSGAPVVYHFRFTTSRYTNFFHHMHSYQDETWPVDLPVSLPATTGEEGRAFENLWSQLPTQATQTKAAAVAPNPTEVQVARIENTPLPALFLVQSPEPLDWSRVTLEVKRAPKQTLPLHFPGTVKITGVSFGALPVDEAVTLLLREPTDLSGYRVEYNSIDNPIDEESWKTYYTFGTEARLAPGTRVRVRSGNQLFSSPAEPEVLGRFIASGSDPGELKFPSNGVYLRLRAPDGAEGHKRPFLPDSSHIAVDPTSLKIIRKVDGTAFFFVVTTDFSPSGYRLTMTYLREKGDSPVLTEVGNSSPEIVVLDIP